VGYYNNNNILSYLMLSLHLQRKLMEAPNKKEKRKRKKAHGTSNWTTLA
jgi:hypothetical protein